MDTQLALDYIKENWHRSIYQDEPGQGFRGIDLPYRYTSPCIKGEGKFWFFFYWDTYFTNVGLLKDGLLDVAKENIQNMLWFVERQGYMPNHVGLYNRSQPPYLCRMVKEYLDASGDTAYLAEAARGLRQEYNFWVTARYTPTGLARHGQQDTAEGAIKFYDSSLVRRLGVSPDAPEEEKIFIGAHHLAEAETGWDFTKRFDGRCLDFNQVELNCLLHEYELFFVAHDETLGWNQKKLWQERAEQRKARIDQYLWSDERAMYLDYDFVNGRHSDIASVATLFPLACGVASEEHAAKVVAQLDLFEREYGVAVTEEYEGCRDNQWAYPNVWPPMVYMVVDGLRRYGYEKDAKRIAQKYVDTSLKLFAETKQLWEKTDAETGQVAGGEYDAAPMLGWSAGVFIAMADYLDNE